MRYAIISDVHANRQAWNAVITDIRIAGADRIICLGDIVGYGPAPAEVLEQVYTRVHHILLGNHDAVICGKLDPGTFNDAARRIIRWTASRLDAKAARFFRKLPLVIHGSDFRCVHAELANPLRFGYVFGSGEAASVLGACREPVVFVGHTHVPGVFVAAPGGGVTAGPGVDFTLAPELRYVVNVGSVGQPRDGDPRAGYCLLDDVARTVVFRRVPFDVDAYRRELDAAGLPAAGGSFIQVSQALAGRPVRETLDFHPPVREDAPAAGHGVQNLESAVRRWRLAALILALLCLTAVGLAPFVLRRIRAAGDETVFAPVHAIAPAVAPGPRADLPLPEPTRGVVGRENPPGRWTVRLARPEIQRVAVEEGDGFPVFRVTCRAPAAFALVSQPVSASAGMRFTARAQVRWQEPFQGYLELCLLQGEGASARVLVRTEPDPAKAGRWVLASATMDRRQGGLRTGGPVRLAVRGTLAGDVLVRKCSLMRRE
ncbi:MAG: metallophosphoesterase family protein [Kiritimatiellaeota bacterium]|nr:metallophosphoesterase family protein [Kiritimatiellota bacterium]